MQDFESLPRTNRLYSITAIVSIFLLLGALVHKGSDGPFGPTLDQVSYGQGAAAPVADAFEIVYFGASACQECETWKKQHLGRWRQAAVSRQVRLTMRSSNCSGATLYAQICTRLGEGVGERPVFVLLHRESSKVLATGEGIGGFYRVARKARTWHEGWAERQRAV